MRAHDMQRTSRSHRRFDGRRPDPKKTRQHLCPKPRRMQAGRSTMRTMGCQSPRHERNAPVASTPSRLRPLRPPNRHRRTLRERRVGVIEGRPTRRLRHLWSSSAGARSKATVTWQVDAPTPVSTCTRDAEHATEITKVRGVPTAPDGTAVTWASPTVARPVRSLLSEVRMTVQPGPCHVWGSIPGVTATSRHEGG
jgi:hypothetical protein